MTKQKTLIAILLVLSICAGLTACSEQKTTDIVATTLPVYEFTAILCDGTDITVSRLITEEVSCLHDYTLQVSQMRMIEAADVIVTSGAGLEAFFSDALSCSAKTIDASQGISLRCFDSHDPHDHSSEHAHSHEHDPHIWLDPSNGKQMARNICTQLIAIYPEHTKIFQDNLATLELRFDELSDYATLQLSNLRCRELITFHDGFSYLAHAYDLSILHAIEEESGSEASAAELIALISIVQENNLQAIFVERSGSTSAAQIISEETGAGIYTLDMAMSGNSYFEAMYHNIDVLKEALG